MTFYTYALPHRMGRRWVVSAGHPQGARYLPVNVRDENDAFVLTAAVPSLKADDVNITVLKDVVRIEGEVEADGNDYLLRELRLPSPLEAEQVEARIADGILTIRLPKAESARPKTIKVAVH